jgi:CHAD domain-containing protein
MCTMAERQARRRLNECAASIPAAFGPDASRDPEIVHALRVGCRRARVTLSEFGDQFAPGPRREARETYREFRKGLGKLRELDVSLALLDNFAEAHRGAVELAKARLREFRQAADDAIIDLESAPRGAGPAAQIAALSDAYRPTTECYRKHAEERLRKRLRKLGRQYKTWKVTKRADDLHDLRVRFKKLRYTLEVYVGLYGKQGKTLLRELENAQDALGDWNDHRILNEYILRMQTEAGDTGKAELSALSEAIAAKTGTYLDTIERATSEFFEKDRIRSAKTLFGHPKVACCDKD